MKHNRRAFIKSTGSLAALSLFPLSSFYKKNNNTVAEKIKPQALKAGDTIAISSPAGAVWEEKQIELFSEILKNLGFKVVFGKTLYERHGYFAGTDKLRAEELNTFFGDKKIKGIFCMKGGWGCAKLLDKIDYHIIKQNPKVLIGFSDITSLLIAITAKTGLITFHGPVGNSGWNEFTKEAFRSVIMRNKEYAYENNPEKEEAITCINEGIAEGELVGGNLSVLCSILGSSYIPTWNNKILFLEDTKEEPYRIDRMLTQLHLNGVLQQVKGIIFGKCNKCLAEEPQKSFTLQEVLNQHLKPLKIPAFYGAMIGHIENKLTIPLGINAKINASSGKIELTESAVI